MIKIVICSPEERSEKFSEGIIGLEVIHSMFSDIAPSVVALLIDKKEVYDLSRPISNDCAISPITVDSETGIEIIRLDAANMMARAIKEMFPDAKLVAGATIKDGFYYDLDLPDAISEKLLLDIEKKLEEIIQKDEKFIRKTWSKKSAIEFFKDLKEPYKVESISQAPEENITVYSHGDFTYLCNGPHSPSSRYVRALKLTKVSGVYWKGDSRNKMLQRVYGTAWPNQESMSAYFHIVQEAEKRDHRKIAKELDWFHMQNEAPGQVFWHNKGRVLYLTIENYIRTRLMEHQYQEVKTPIMLDKDLWKKSGHWEKFKENMFITHDEKKEIAIKPMNCPCHVEIFKSKTRSYKELPIRMAEFGTCHRNEPSGSLYGLMRVRGFTQDDAHIFCTQEQVRDEVLKFYKLLVRVYSDFGFNEISVKLSDRPENRIGEDEIWDLSEKALADSMRESGVTYTINKGEGAFYGPKLEFVLKDAIGREWQCGTVQLDFVLPSRLGAFYVGEDGKKHHPVIIHRAILGTLERFIGILIEHHAGDLPVWLAPVQLSILTVHKEAAEYARSLYEQVLAHNIRVELNDTEENISHKVRKSIFNKIPVVWTVGRSEASECSVCIKVRGSSATHSMEAGKALKTLLTYASIR